MFSVLNMYICRNFGEGKVSRHKDLMLKTFEPEKFVMVIFTSNFLICSSPFLCKLKVFVRGKVETFF